MCLVIKTLFILLGVYFVGVFRVVASGLPILSLELNQIFIKSSKKYKNNYNWLKQCTNDRIKNESVINKKIVRVEEKSP